MDNTLLICLEKELSHDLIQHIAQLKPNRVICLDEGFRNNDQLKTNAKLMMQDNGVEKFQTV
jgi:adenine-specific DNA-methyltransferase